MAPFTEAFFIWLLMNSAPRFHMKVQKLSAFAPSPSPITDPVFRRSTPSQTTLEIMFLIICCYPVNRASIWYYVIFDIMLKYWFFLIKSSSVNYLRCLSFGTTHVPLARHTTIGSSRTSHAESLMSGLGAITLRASNTIYLDVFPSDTISQTASI